MSLTSLQHLNEFRSIIAPWKSLYKYADIACVSLKTQDSEFLLFGRIILEFLSPQNAQPFKLVTEQITAHRMQLKIGPTEVDTIVDRLSHGQISLESALFSLKGSDDRLLSFLFPLFHPSIASSGGPRLPTLVIYGSPKEPLLHQLGFKPVEQLDWALKALDQPFDSFDELLALLGLPRLPQLGDSTAIELIARAPIGISEESRIDKGEAIVICRAAPGFEVSKLKIGYKVLRKDSTDRSFVMGDALRWKDEQSFLQGELRIPVNDSAVAHVFASYEGTVLQQWWLTDPTKHLNTRNAVYEIFDKDLSVIKRFLAGQGNNRSDDFEGGISLLLYLMGFSPAHLGITKLLGDGPDILASTSQGNLAVIECTTGMLNEANKLAKLIKRSTLIRQQLASSGYGHILVQPIIVTPLERASVQAELDEAGKYGIAVVCKEELESLVRDIRVASDSDSFLIKAKELIPKPPNQSNQQALFSVHE